jgi:hypothetical protein
LKQRPWTSGPWPNGRAAGSKPDLPLFAVGGAAFPATTERTLAGRARCRRSNSCQKCQAPPRLIALVKSRDVAKKILTAMHLPTEVQFKQVWRVGTTHVVFTPHELIEKLIPLIPPPTSAFGTLNLLPAHGAAGRV